MIAYGLDFGDSSRLEIELYCVAKGGKWTVNGSECGAGLFHHYMQLRKIIWPKRYCHRWTELLYREFIQNDLTVLMGSASSQKTSHAVEYVLLNYWARPEKTLVVLSTVNMDKLDIGIWAELKTMWESARNLHPDLAGNLLDHKRAITTDDLETSVRDFRKGVICFPEGTTVDTSNGPVPIESVRAGDVVINANGTGRVKQASSRTADRLVRVTFNDGRIIDCTAEHPFLTMRGWTKAIDLETFDWVLSADEALQVLREKSCPSLPKQQVVLRRMLKGRRLLQKLSKSVSCCESRKEHGQVLLLPVRNGVPQGQSVYARQNVPDMQQGVSRPPQSRVLFSPLPGVPIPYSVRELQEDISSTKNNPPYSFLQFVLRRELEPSSHFQEAKKADTTDRGRDGGVEHVSGLGSVEPPSPSQQPEKEVKGSEVVQDRHCVSRNQTGSGTRRAVSPNKVDDRTRQAAGQRAFGAWVDSVEVLEPRGDPRFSESEGGYRVCNLEVEGHPSYSVNGLLVHNCRPCYQGGKFVGLGILAGVKQEYIFYVCDELQFMQEAFSGSWPHLFSNGNVKIIGSGNPKHDPEDELGKTSEPREGWSNHPEPTKTEVWPTKFMGGHCVNLVGTDSPNFEVSEGQPEPYPKLIGRRFATRIAHDFGENSFQFYQLVKGVMRVQFAKDRVITRALCRQHGAMDLAVWETNQKTGIYALDPTYGGEDRCIGMPLWFGKDVEGKEILQVGQYRVFKFDLTSDIPIEDQIADICSEELKVWGINANNLFYDSTGKGTIGAAFARKFGTVVPVAVDSGGKCSLRPVRQDLWVDEPDGSRRLKRCDEYYSKFVSEMWFSVRYCIEANQMRELPEDVMAEGCARIYEVVVGNKIQVEPKTDPKKKEDLKRRLGKSPDLFDCLAIGIEGARQRGFAIARLGTGVSLPGQSDDFFDKEAKEWEEAINSNLLNHALPS